MIKLVWVFCEEGVVGVYGGVLVKLVYLFLLSFLYFLVFSVLKWMYEE